MTLEFSHQKDLNFCSLFPHFSKSDSAASFLNKYSLLKMLPLDRFQYWSPLWHRPHPGPFDFLGLPTDIRVMIYEEAFAEDAAFEQKFQLARSNKKIYGEGLPLLYKTHSFKFGVCFDVWRMGRSKFLGFYDLGGLHLSFKEAPQDMLALMTDMEIFLDEACLEQEGESNNTIAIQMLNHVNLVCTGLRSLRIQTQGLAHPMCLTLTVKRHGAYGFRSPPYRRAMVKVLRALAQRLSCLQFQAANRLPGFEEFLGQIAPLKYWDNSSALKSKVPRERYSEYETYELLRRPMGVTMDNASSGEAPNYEENMVCSEDEDSDDESATNDQNTGTPAYDMLLTLEVRSRGQNASKQQRESQN